MYIEEVSCFLFLVFLSIREKLYSMRHADTLGVHFFWHNQDRMTLPFIYDTLVLFF